MYLKHGLSENGNQLLKRIMESDLNEGKSEWSRTLKKYMDMAKINLVELVTK